MSDRLEIRLAPPTQKWLRALAGDCETTPEAMAVNLLDALRRDDNCAERGVERCPCGAYDCNGCAGGAPQ